MNVFGALALDDWATCPKGTNSQNTENINVVNMADERIPSPILGQYGLAQPSIEVAMATSQPMTHAIALGVRMTLATVNNNDKLSSKYAPSYLKEPLYWTGPLKLGLNSNDRELLLQLHLIDVTPSLTTLVTTRPNDLALLECTPLEYV